MIQLISTIIVVVVGSAFFSGLEAALFAVPESRAQMYAIKGVAGGKALRELKHDLSPAITLIVIGNNIFNIVGSIMVGVFATQVLGDALLGVISALMTLAVILFGEIIPKAIGENNADAIGLRLAPMLRIAVIIFAPIIWIITRITRLLRKEKAIVTEDELAILSTLSHQDGAIETDEHDMIQRVFTLNDLTAKDIMTRRNEMVAYQESATIGHLEEKIYESQHSRIPVYGKDMDDITGVVWRWELLVALAQDRQRDQISEFVRPALYIPSTMKADALLPLFQKKQQHLAIVRDRNRMTLGVVTLEDVIEELVGVIQDETDEE